MTRLALEFLEDRTVPTAANMDFVNRVYTDLLLRPADAGGLSAWTSSLDAGMSPGEIAKGFTGSAEYRNLVVNQDYELLLKRAPDAGGLAFWTNMLANGASQSQVLAGIASSQEFFQTQGGSTNTGFVTALYQDALNRSPDAGGLAGFTGDLAAGASRYQVALAIFTSGEYYTDVVEGYYHQFLNRAADAGGLANYVQLLEAGMPNETVIDGIIGSQEFFTLAQPPTTPTTHPVKVVAPGNQSSNEGAAVSGVTATASGGNGAAFTFAATGLPPGLSINHATGAITGTLTNQSAGSYTVTITASDGVDSGSSNFTWSVADTTTPVVTAPANQTSTVGTAVSNVKATATDADGDTITFSATGLPAGLTISSTTGAITGTPTAAGTFNVTVKASDGHNTGSATFTWIVNATGAPVVTPPANQTNNEGDTPSNVTATATGGNGGTLTFSATGLPAGLSINPSTGAITGTLTNQSAGSYNITVSASDGTNTGSAMFTWTVNDTTVPALTPPPDQVNTAGDTVSGVTVTATDADGDPLTFSATGLPSGLTINTTTGVISGTIASTASGTFAVTVNATDGHNTGTTHFNWVVNSASAPHVTPPADQTNNELDNVTGVTVSATGGNGHALTFGATGLPAGLQINSGTGEITGTLTGTSAGSYTVTVTASDGTNVGHAQFHWTVTDNTTPVVTPPADQTNNELDAITGVSASATDADGDTLTFTATGLPPGLTIDSSTGAITGTLSGQSVGSYTVTINASDGHNTGSATFTWTVHDNTTPALTVPADQTNKEGDVVTGVTAHATDGDGDALTYSATSLPTGLSINPTTGEITGTIASGAAGTYNVTINVTDGTNTDTGHFTWTVTSPTPVVTPPGDQTNNEGDVVTGVSAHATGGNGNALTYSATGLPPGLTINPQTGEITGTLTDQSAGDYHPVISVTDGTNTGTANFHWTVNDITTPIVVPPTAQTNHEGDTVSGVGVLASDADHDTLTFAATNLPPGLTIDATTGVISGTLAAGSAGTYTVTVTASDGFNTGTANFSWVVMP